jgi:hypothetical protein
MAAMSASLSLTVKLVALVISTLLLVSVRLSLPDA